MAWQLCKRQRKPTLQGQHEDIITVPYFLTPSEHVVSSETSRASLSKADKTEDTVCLMTAVYALCLIIYVSSRVFIHNLPVHAVSVLDNPYTHDFLYVVYMPPKSTLRQFLHVICPEEEYSIWNRAVITAGVHLSTQTHIYRCSIDMRSRW